MASIAAYWVLLLFTLGLSRLREYYADRHSASIVDDGPRKLSVGLAKIVSKTGRMKSSRRREAFSFSSFKALFISDPDKAERDTVEIAKYTASLSDQALVERLLKKRVRRVDRIMELLSTHPNLTKRLKALQVLRT